MFRLSSRPQAAAFQLPGLTMNLSAYLRRIRYEGPLVPTFDTLRALHRAHAMAIPYENFDVQLRRPVTIDPQAAFEKLVERKRGGWCYEMNGVFGLVLDKLGFEITRRSADGSSAHSHLFLTVNLDGTTYVCDVGFSDGPIEPYPIVEGPFTQEGFEFRIENEASGRWRLHNHRFGAAPNFLAGLPDEAAMADRCQWLQTAPDSLFVQHALVFSRTRGGISSLIDRTLRTITPTEAIRTVIDDADEYVATLKTRFSLDLPEAATLWPALCERHEKYLCESAARKAAKAGS
jgi:N-hydroxyarylamine O-acetyltransferase